MTVMEERTLALLSPMWQRIARGEVNLDQYTDEEIRTGQITMADGRLLPAPAVLPDVFVIEQERRALRTVQRKVREGAVKSLDVVLDILEDTMAEDKDRLKAAEMLQDRYLGKATSSVKMQVTVDGPDPRELLLERLLAARTTVVGPAALDDVLDAEIVDDGLGLEDLL